MYIQNKQLFQYAVISQPKQDANGNVTEEAKIVIEPKTVLATDQTQATLLAGREIPEEELENLDRLQVVVRPF